MAMIYIWIMYRRREISSPMKVLYQTFLFVIFASVAWEIFEAYYGIAAPVGGGYVVDTARDLVGDFLGGAIGIALGLNPLIHKQHGL